MAMIGATVLEPGIYFAMNSPVGLIGTTAANAPQVISGWGFSVTPDMISQMAQSVGERHCCLGQAVRRHWRWEWPPFSRGCSAGKP
jgi:carbon starvation protein CstA